MLFIDSDQHEFERQTRKAEQALRSFWVSYWAFWWIASPELREKHY